MFKVAYFTLQLLVIEVKRYPHDNKWFWKPSKCILKPTALLTNKAEQEFFITLCYIVLFCDINFTVLPLDRPITAEYSKGFSMKTSLYQHTLFVNNSNNNHYFTNHSTNNTSVFTSDQLNSKTEL